jgi:chemotaxis protein CheC
MNELTDFQQDVISELLNIGMGRAAASLSEMVGEVVELSVPRVEFIPRYMAANRIKEIVGNDIIGVKETFNGSFWGDAILLFPEDRCQELVRALLRDASLPTEMITEMEQEAITEVGNIILNSCLGSLANIFQQNLEYGLPEYTNGSCDLLFGLSGGSVNTEGVLLLHMDFILQQTNITGYLTLLMNVDSMQSLSEQIDVYLAKVI